MSQEAIFSCNLQRNGVSSCLLQEKSPPVTLLVCKIIRLQVIQNNLHMSTILQEPEISFSPKFALQVARTNCLVWQRLNEKQFAKATCNATVFQVKRETASFKLQEKPPHTTTCIWLKFYRNCAIYFSPKFALQIERNNYLVWQRLQLFTIRYGK